MYLNGFSSARGCQALELLILVYLLSVPIDFRPTDGEVRISTNFPTLGFDLSLLRYTLTLQQYFHGSASFRSSLASVSSGENKPCTKNCFEFAAS